MANKVDNAAMGTSSSATITGAFNGERGINYPDTSMETRATDVKPGNTRKPGAAPKADAQPVKKGTYMSKHTPDMLFDKDRV